MSFKYVSTVGSVPYTDSNRALEILLKYTPELIAWPQLPKRSFREGMCAQYSENFPGLVLDEQNQKIYIDKEKAQNESEKFYSNYLDENIEYFSISRDYASGFYQLLDYITGSNKKSKLLKCQTTGPLTFGLTLKDNKGQSIFYDSLLKDIVKKQVVMKSAWQLNKLITADSNLSTVIISLDEPYLAAYGSAFTSISKEDVVDTLQEVTKDLKERFDKKIDLFIGVHCCANTDWSLLLDIENINIISFDAYEFFDSLLLYIDSLKDFINRGGILAWGIVPSTDKVRNETKEKILAKFNSSIEILSKKGIDRNKLLENIIITPSCGLGSLSEDLVEPVLSLCKNLFENITENK